MRYVINKPLHNGLRGIEFFVNEGAVPETYISDQLKIFSDAIGSGVVFAPGKGELRIGWVTADLVQTSDGYLQIQEPDFIHFPIRPIPGLTITLQHFKRQVETAEKLGLTALFNLPTIDQSCLVCNRFDQSRLWIMERFDAVDDDSGWYIGCADENHNHNDPQNLRRISLYEGCLGRPAIIDHVALPEGVWLSFHDAQLKSATYKSAEIV